MWLFTLAERQQQKTRSKWRVRRGRFVPLGKRASFNDWESWKVKSFLCLKKYFDYLFEKQNYFEKAFRFAKIYLSLNFSKLKN